MIRSKLVQALIQSNRGLSAEKSLLALEEGNLQSADEVTQVLELASNASFDAWLMMT